MTQDFTPAQVGSTPILLYQGEELQVHPAAELFPMLEGKAFDELVEDIRQNGQKESVTFFRGQLLDGRNRYRACQVLGIEPDVCEIDDDYELDPVAWVLSHNLYRRHLTESQRAMVAAKLAKLKRGDNQHTKEDGQICLSTTEAAEQLQVSPQSVKNAKTVLREGSEELQQAVESGEVKVSRAAKLAKSTPKAKQAEEASKKPEKKPKPKYLEASLQGKWISLAALWIENNSPCKVSEYLSQVSPLMPTHIMKSNGKRATKISLAKQALSRIIKGGTSLVCTVDNGVVQMVGKKDKTPAKPEESTAVDENGEDGFPVKDHVEAIDALYDALRSRLVRFNEKGLQGAAIVIAEVCMEYGIDPRPHFRGDN